MNRFSIFIVVLFIVSIVNYYLRDYIFLAERAIEYSSANFGAQIRILVRIIYMVYYRVYTVDVALDYELCDNNSSKVFRLRKSIFF